MRDKNEALEAAKRDVLLRMSGCADPNCSACRSNRADLERLIRIAQSDPTADPTVLDWREK